MIESLEASMLHGKQAAGGPPGSRCILVLSLPGSGSSAVAGLLSKLGVMMGETLVPADASNPRGHYEDLHFRQLLYGYRSDRAVLRRIRHFLDGRFARYDLWGLKEPAILEAINDFAAALEHREVRCILVKRDRTACVRSYRAKVASAFGREAVDRMGATHSNLARYCRRMERNCDSFLKTYRPRAMPVAFNALTADVEEQVRRIAAFVFERLRPPAEDRIARAVEFVDPEANHRREIPGAT